MSFPNPVAGTIHPASWVRPAGNVDFEVTSPFGPRIIVVDGVRRTANHNGLDIGNGRAGAPVLAQASGRVVEWRPTLDGVVTIQTHDNQWRLVAAHMTSIPVRLGNTVTAGQRIGSVGNVGVSSAAHLHFENKRLINGAYVAQDPWFLLTQNELPDSATGANTLTEVTITLFPDGPHVLNIPAGGKVDGYNAQGLVKSQTFPSGSSSVADGAAVIVQNPQKAPNGTFYRCSGGIFAGLYIPHTQVTNAGPVNPPTAGDCSAVEAQLAKRTAELAAATSALEAAETRIVQIKAKEAAHGQDIANT